MRRPSTVMSSERRRGGQVVIPHAVMHGLEVPGALPGLDVDRDNGFGKQPVALAEAAVVIAVRRRRRQIDEPELVIPAHHRPHVGVAGVAMRAVLPGLDPELAVARNHVEDPLQLAGPHIERLHVAGHPFLDRRPIRHRRTDNHRIAHDDRRRINRDVVALAVELVQHPSLRARQRGQQIRFPGFAERRDRFAALRIEREQVAVERAHQDALVVAAVGPVRDTARQPSHGVGLRALRVRFGVVEPQRLAARRIDRGDLAESGAHVHHAVHDEGRGLQAIGGVGLFRVVGDLLDQIVIGRRPRPRDFQIAEVVARDLGKRRVLLAPVGAAMAGPITIGA